MAVACLGIVGSATVTDHTGPVSIPISVDVPASDPVAGGTLVMLFTRFGSLVPTTTPGPASSCSDTAPRAGVYAYCNQPNFYTKALSFGELTEASDDTLSAQRQTGSPYHGIVFYPLRAGLDSIIYEPGAGYPFDLDVFVIAWTGVTTAGATLGWTPNELFGAFVTFTAGVVRDTDASLTGQKLIFDWDPTHLKPRAAFPQSGIYPDDNYMQMVVGVGVGHIPHFNPIDWQYNAADYAIYVACDNGHQADISESGLTWDDGSISAITSALDFESPIAHPVFEGSSPAQGAIMSIVVGEYVAPPLTTDMDFSHTWSTSGPPSNYDIADHGAVIPLVAGPGPAVCPPAGIHAHHRLRR